jgi:cephalosporin hydroxylase
MDRPFVSYAPVELLRAVQRGTMQHTHWKGVGLYKNPFDLSLYQQLIWQLQPKTIFEVGTRAGGSALWFRDQCQAMGLYSRVVSIDPMPEKRQYDYSPDIEFVESDVRDLAGSSFASWAASFEHPWLVSEDSDHMYDVVSASIHLFAPLMYKGDYLVVEDGVMETFGNSSKYNGGPPQAIRDFLDARDNFQIDTTYCDRYGYNVTWAPNGWLRKTK